MPRSSLLCRLARLFVVGGIALLVACAYGYSAVFADIGDTILGPAIVQEGLRGFIIAQIGKALWLRWRDFTPWQRAQWAVVALGVILNLARGHFSGTPITLSFTLLHLGLISITWRLMSPSHQEVTLRRERDEARAEVARLRGEA